jgi:hypothetical protein
MGSVIFVFVTLEGPTSVRLSKSIIEATMTIDSRTLSRSDVADTWRRPLLIIGFGCLISLMSFGPRSSLGFFLTPMSEANHWGRDVFAFGLALQNLLWA